MLNWAYLPYTLLLSLFGIVALALSFYAARHRNLRGATAFMLMCLAGAEWAFTYALELSSAGLTTKLFWSKLEYLGITAGPVCWLAFAISYTRRDVSFEFSVLSFELPGPKSKLKTQNSKLKTPRSGVWLLLSLVPLTTLALVFTNEAHHLIWRDVTLVVNGPFPTLRNEYGSWFWVHTTFSYLCVLIGSAVLLSGLLEARRFYRRQRLALLAGIVTAWASNILYVAKLSPVPNLDLTPFGAIVTAVAFALALFPFRLLDLVPVARRAMMDSMADAVIALDAQNQILELNNAASRILGVAHTAAIGRPARQVLEKHIDLVERFRDVLEVHTEIVRDTTRGPRYFELQIMPLRDAVGQYSGRLITLHDVTERKRAQEEIQVLNTQLEERVLARTAELAAANEAKEQTLLREQAARQDLAFLAEASRILAGSLDEASTLNSLAHHIVPYLADACAIHVVDEAGALQRRAVRHIDPAKTALIADIEQRYPMEYQAPGSASHSGFPHVVSSGEPDFHPRVKDEDLIGFAHDERHLALLRGLEISSYVCVPLVGRERTLGAITLLRCRASRSPESKVLSPESAAGDSGLRTQDFGLPEGQYNPTSLALATDLAQRTALAVENAQLYLAAQRAVQVRDEFLTVASHELKTPLTSLLLALHMLVRQMRRGTLPPADYLTRRLSIVQEQSKRLDQLVSNLLDISRMTAGRLQLEPQVADLADLGRRTVEHFQDELAAARCPVRLQADTPVRGYWDPARIEQVIANLLTNAMKYGRGHPVSVTVTADGSSAQLVVSDQGIGIAPEHLDRIFGRFERAVAPGQYSGMGMGLYITRQLVEAHGGSIAVTSTPEKGATFTVTLPLAGVRGEGLGVGVEVVREPRVRR